MDDIDEVLKHIDSEKSLGYYDEVIEEKVERREGLIKIYE